MSLIITILVVAKLLKMISTTNHTKIIQIFDYIATEYEKTLQFHVERYSNNKYPLFTDVQAMTMYVYCTVYEKRVTLKDMYNFVKSYLSDIFVNLPSYVAFCNRIARLSPAFNMLFNRVVTTNLPIMEENIYTLMDSMPIITCSGKRKAKVAREIANKGVCSTKSMYYYGVKLHALAVRVKGALPFPESVVITPASESDLNVFRDNWSELKNRVFFADKIYQSTNNEQYIRNFNSELLSPVKYHKNVPKVIKQFNKAKDDLCNRAVSAIRQPIEGLFNWLIETTSIQRASKVRSTKGLLAFIFGKLSAALAYKYIFNP
ncbi:MAG: transposase [Bacteroidales bacterium]